MSSWSASRTPRPSRSPIASSAPDQKTFPITDASCRSPLRSGVNVSSRAEMIAWMPSGNGISAPSASSQVCPRGTSRPRSLSILTNSSA